MDLAQSTILALQYTLSPEQQIREQAEAQLEKLKSQEGFAQILLRVIASNEVDISIRQAGAVYLKNMTVVRWRGSIENQSKMSDADAQFIKDNILEALVHTHHLIKSQVIYMIELIANRDFPEQWESFLSKTVQFIQSNNPDLLMAGLSALKVAMKKFQFIPAGETRREPLFKICDNVFPLLQQILNQLGAATAEQQTDNVAIMQRRIFKIFHYTVNFDVPKYIVDPAVFKAWMEHFFRVIRMPIPSNSDDDPVKNPWWLLKKCVARILNSLLVKQMQLRRADYETKRQLAELFMTNYALPTLQLFHEVLAARASQPADQPFHDRYLLFLIEYFTTAVSYGRLYPILKPGAMAFIRQTILPLLCFNQIDQELFEDDPHEFLRSQMDTIKEYYTPRQECLNFMLALVEKRGRGNLDQIIAICMELLNRYQATPVAQRNTSEKYAVFSIIATMSTYLKKMDPYRGMLEQTMVVHVLPELSSPLGHIRAHAIWIFSEFYNITFTNPANFANALKAIVDLMMDRELPVRVRAGMAICNLVRVKQGIAELRPVLPQLLNKIFELMGEIDSDDLITSLTTIVRRYQSEIAPYAVSLCTRLAETFFRLIEADNDSSQIAASECLITFRTLLSAMVDIPNIFLQLEPIIVPVLAKIITPNHILYFEEAMRILSFITFYPKTISENVWQLFPKIVELFHDSAMDMIDSMVNPLDNYISYGTEQFLAPGTPYLGMITGIYEKTVGDHRMPAYESKEACKLMESVLQRCRGRVDSIIGPVLQIAITRLMNKNKENDVSKELVVYLLEIVANCLYYNPKITIDFLGANNAIEPVFQTWFQHFKKFQRYYDKKITLLGICSLLNMNPTPVFVQNGATLLLDKVIKLMKEMLIIEKQLEKEDADRAKEEAEEDQYDEEDEDDYDIADDDEMYGDDDQFELHAVPDDQDADDPEEVYLDELEKLTEHLGEGGDLEGDGDFGEAEIEGEDIEGDSEEELFEDEDSSTSFETPIDDVDELEFMVNSFNTFFAVNPQLTNTVLDAKQHARIKKYVELIPVRKAKEAEIRRKEEEEEEKRKVKANKHSTQ